VKDLLFSGPDVEEAVALAAASLGLPKADLRYVVLEAGAPGGRGLKPTPARIAVLVEERGGAAPPRPAAPAPAAEPVDPRVGLRETVQAVVRAGGLDVSAEIEETDETVVVRVSGPDEGFFLAPGGRADVLRATEHLLQRLYGTALQPRALRLTSAGFRAGRDQALAEDARRVAGLVRADGQPRALEPLNAYERRVVHVALQDEPGVTTYSVGEGPDRRVTVAPAGARGAGDDGE
jgi:spoIIIJ-associated protein